MLISDEFNGQPPLSGHLPSPRGWPLDGGSELIQLFTPFKSSVKKYYSLQDIFLLRNNNNLNDSRICVFSFTGRWCIFIL